MSDDMEEGDTNQQNSDKKMEEPATVDSYGFGVGSSPS